MYLIVIGLTGSILVFRQELESLTGLNSWGNVQLRGPIADLTKVVHKVQEAYPGHRVLSIFTPTEVIPVFLAAVQDRRGRITVAADASGKVLGEVRRSKSWLTFTQDLHITLLMGPKGRAANGIGGALLLLVNATGFVIWWPGIRVWRRALTVDFRRRWRRINFDLHSAVGFWTLAIVSFWALSGIYFGWSRQVFTFVNRISPVLSAKPPVIRLGPVSEEVTQDLSAVIAQARALAPGDSLEGIAFPYSRRAPLEVFMRRGEGMGKEYTDTLYFNPWNGKYIQTWRYGVNESFGDWFIWAQVPLHYGTYWGLAVKILWASLGMAIPLLTVTGVILYWNRFLRHKCRPQSSSL